MSDIRHVLLYIFYMDPKWPKGSLLVAFHVIEQLNNIYDNTDDNMYASMPEVFRLENTLTLIYLLFLAVSKGV